MRYIEALTKCSQGVLLDVQELKDSVDEKVIRSDSRRFLKLLVCLNPLFGVRNYVQRTTEHVPSGGVLEESRPAPVIIDEVANATFKVVDVL